MCGIAGYIGRRDIDDAQIERALESMRTRGPDYRAIRRLPCGDSQAIFLHGRLSIIDLDPRSHQPFRRGNLTTAFNGEIYNYIEVREQLEREHGAEFHTASDTEVLVAAWEEWGVAALDRSEGMWAFAIHDARTGEVVLSRDRFGEKPLWIYRAADGIYFASEIRTLFELLPSRPSLNWEHISRYLVNGFRSLYKTEQSYYEGVELLPAGHCLVIHPESAPRLHRYWNPAMGPADESMTLAACIEETHDLLRRSTALRLRADVPLAFCLSGGIDSSALIGLAVKECGYAARTYSIIDPDPRYNEEQHIKETLDYLGCPGTMITLKHGDALTRLRDLVTYRQAPVATISYLVHSYLSEAIAADGIKVVLSGTGADELFTGYYDHYLFQLAELASDPSFPARRKEWEEHVQSFVRTPLMRDLDRFLRNPGTREHLYPDTELHRKILRRPFHEPFTERPLARSLLRNRMLNELVDEIVPVILIEDDLNSMRYSLENRSPYLDSKLFELSCRIPSRHLIQNGYAKYPLREAIKGVIPESVRLEREKKGFNASLASLFDLKSPKFKDYLCSSPAMRELVDMDQVCTLLDADHIPNTLNKFLFGVINVRILFEINAI